MVLKYKRDDYKEINSLEDGNCAFNAYTLAFVDLALGGFIENYAKENRFTVLLEKLSKAHPEVKDWDSFKKFLLDHKDQTRYLQLSLAPIFREIAVELKEQDFKINGIHPGEVARFETEFRDYVYNQFQIRLKEHFKGGDIFCRIGEVVQKYDEASLEIFQKLSTNQLADLSLLAPAFEAVNQYIDLTPEQKLTKELFEDEVHKALDGLKIWLEKEGYRQFLNHQRQSAQWAGDVELGPLCEHLGFNLIVYTKDNTLYEIRNFHGILPSASFSPYQKRVLKDRRIVDRTTQDKDSAEFVLLELDESELNRKLEAVPSCEIVVDHWLANQEAITQGKVKVPDNWIPGYPNMFEAREGQVEESTLYHLLDRDIIYRDDKTDEYYFNRLEPHVFMERVMAAEGAEDIRKAWKKHYKEFPFITLSNPRSTHWYYFQPKNFTHWNLSELEVKNLPYFDGDILQQLLERASALDQDNNEEDLQAKLNEDNEVQEEDDEEQDKNKITKMRYVLQQVLYDDEDYDSLGGDENSGQTSPDITGKSPKYNFLIDSSQFIPPQINSLVTGDLKNLPGYDDERIKAADDTNISITTDAYGYSSLRFFHTPTSSPPYKKLKAESSHMKDAANRAKESLESYTKHENADIAAHATDLIAAYNCIAKGGEIPKAYIMQLLLPKEYLSSMGKNIEFLPPEEVVEFTNQNINQILYQANSYLAETVKHFYFLILQTSKIILNSEAISLLNKLFTHLLQHLVLTGAYRKLITDFNFNDEDLTTQLTPENIVKLKRLFTDCKLVAEKMNIQRCASHILAMPEINHYPPYQELFKKLSEVDLANMNPIDLIKLRHIDCASIEDKNLLSAIDSFKKLYDHDVYETLPEEFKHGSSFGLTNR